MDDGLRPFANKGDADSLNHVRSSDLGLTVPMTGDGGGRAVARLP